MLFPNFYRRNTVIGLALSFFLNSIPAIAAQAEPDWQVHEKAADSLQRSRRYDDAIDEYYKEWLALKADLLTTSDDAQILYREVAFCLSQAGHKDSADALEKALIKQPSKAYSKVVSLNNDSVRALNKSDYATAIATLERVVRLSPDYKVGRGNLAIAYNNRALSLFESNPQEATRLFRRALLLSPENGTTRTNLQGAMRRAGKDPNNFGLRVAQAEAALAKGDGVTAYVEYSEALVLKDDPAIKEKRSKVQIDDPMFRADLAKMDELKRIEAVEDIDFGPYMADLQTRIKKNWFPPKGNVSKKIDIRFKVHTNGKVSNIWLAKRSGEKAADDAAIDAISTAKFAPLPEGSPPDVDIQFTFDYNVYKESGEQVNSRKNLAGKSKTTTATTAAKPVAKSPAKPVPKVAAKPAPTSATKPVVKSNAGKPAGAGATGGANATDDSASETAEWPVSDQSDDLIEEAADLAIPQFRRLIVERNNKKTLQLLESDVQGGERALDLAAGILHELPSALPKFDAAVKSLNKNPDSPESLVELASEEEKKQNYQTALVLLDEAIKRDRSGSLKLKLQKQHNTCFGLFLASGLGKQNAIAASYPYDLFCPNIDVTEELLQALIPVVEEPQARKELPPLPTAFDLKATLGISAPRKAVPAQSDALNAGKVESLASAQVDDINSLVTELVASGTKFGAAKPTTPSLFVESKDAKLEPRAEPVPEIKKITVELRKDYNDTSLRQKQSALLLKYGNSLMQKAEWADAACKYRQAIYMCPDNEPAAAKLKECLKKLGINPDSPVERLQCVEQLIETKCIETTLGELREYNKLEDDVLVNTLLALVLIRDDRESKEGYILLSKSLARAYPPGSEKALASAHMVVVEIVGRDLSRAKNKKAVVQICKDLNIIGIECRRALLLDPKLDRAIDRMVSASKEAVAVENNATNNLMLGSAYLLSGDKTKAGSHYATASTKAPNDDMVKEALSNLKNKASTTSSN